MEEKILLKIFEELDLENQNKLLLRIADLILAKWELFPEELEAVAKQIRYWIVKNSHSRIEELFFCRCK